MVSTGVYMYISKLLYFVRHCLPLFMTHTVCGFLAFPDKPLSRFCLILSRPDCINVIKKLNYGLVTLLIVMYVPKQQCKFVQRWPNIGTVVPILAIVSPTYIAVCATVHYAWCQQVLKGIPNDKRAMSREFPLCRCTYHIMSLQLRSFIHQVLSSIIVTITTAQYNDSTITLFLRPLLPVSTIYHVWLMGCVDLSLFFKRTH